MNVERKREDRETDFFFISKYLFGKLKVAYLILWKDSIFLNQVIYI